MKEHWIDTRLTEKEMNFLRDVCSDPEHKGDWNRNLAGNISKSKGLVDKDNWFFETVLKGLTEKLFYRDWDNYRKYYIEKEEPPPKFEMNSIWVNYQKQYEFNPIHNHTALYSFVIFMKIPTHWKEQHALPINVDSTVPCASDFEFIWTEKGSEMCENMGFRLCSEDEGRMLFFPATLKHQVYPFYECEEKRITISGNIIFVDPNKPKKQELSIDQYEEKKKILKMMENNVEMMKKELEQVKKERENVGSI